ELDLQELLPERHADRGAARVDELDQERPRPVGNDEARSRAGENVGRWNLRRRMFDRKPTRRLGRERGEPVRCQPEHNATGHDDARARERGGAGRSQPHGAVPARVTKRMRNMVAPRIASVANTTEIWSMPIHAGSCTAQRRGTLDAPATRNRITNPSPPTK